MAIENVEKFEELIRTDETLREKLNTAAAAYDGEATDEAAFEALIAPLAGGLGLPFTFDECMSYTSLSRELNDEELATLAGGGVCYLIGGSNGPEAECNSGIGDCEGHACVYAGVSF